MISDSSDSEEDDSEDDHQFDRISDILSNLIQEANEAVNYEKTSTTTSSIPLVRKLSSSSNVETVQQKKKLYKANNNRPTSYPSSSSLISIKRRSSGNIVVPRPSHVTTTIASTKSIVKRQRNGDQIMESFKRLDSSMALIDSLSRDLVPNNNTFSIAKKSIMSTPFDSRLSALLLLPLLHVPHALISLVFDTIVSSDNITNNTSNNSSSNTLGGMVVWAFIFAITNLVVDKAVNTPKNIDSTKLLPGTFEQQKSNKSTQSKKRPTKVYNKKRNSLQQQQQPQVNTLLFEKKNILTRRNSL